MTEVRNYWLLLLYEPGIYCIWFMNEIHQWNKLLLFTTFLRGIYCTWFMNEMHQWNILLLFTTFLRGIYCIWMKDMNESTDNLLLFTTFLRGTYCIWFMNEVIDEQLPTTTTITRTFCTYEWHLTNMNGLINTHDFIHLPSSTT